MAGEFRVGDIIGGDYEVLKWIGAGGMGNVYRVRHTMMNSDYALKTLSADKVTEVAWRRFQNEAQAIARMSHPNIVGIYNLGLHEGRLPYYVMDILEGDTLNDLLRDRGPMPVKEALTLFVELCGGFGYAHKKGIVHRDIKPPNIVLLNKPAPNCKAKIVDFGIAKLSGIKDPQNQFLTSAGEVCGSPYYMSPEQTVGQRIDARSDIYSLGCTLFEALTGAPPLRGRSAVDTMMMHQTTAPPSLKTASGGKEFPESLETIMATLLAKEPMNRYQSMEQVAQDLSAVLAGEQTAVNTAINPYAAQMQRAGAEKDATGKFRARERLYQPEEDSDDSGGGLNKPLIALVAVAIIATGGGVGGFLYWKNQTTSHKTVTASAAPAAAAKPQQFEALCKSGPTELKDAENVIEDNDRNKTPPSVSLKETTPYSHLGLHAGRPSRIFDFPSDITIGDIRSTYNTFAPGAVGTRYYLDNDVLSFTPDPILLKYPQYVKRFRKGDLKGLHISGNSATNDLLKVTHTIPGVSKLQFGHCPKLTVDCFKYIADMPSLTALQFDDESFSPEQLSHLPLLSKIPEIGFSYQKDADPYLKLIKGSPAVKTLVLTRSTVGRKGFEYIASLPNLVKLVLEGSEISSADIKLLAGMPKLKAIFFTEQKIDALMLSSLKKLKNVEFMSIDVNAAAPMSDARLMADLNWMKFQRFEKARED